MVLLHGFAGSGASWDAVRTAAGGEAYPALAPDLPACGIEGCVRFVLDAAPPSFELAGYSLGARVALHVALAAPERVRRLVLVAGTAGLESEEERSARRAADDALAARLEGGGVEAFAAFWSAQPLFADDPPAVRAAQEAEVRSRDASTLAAMLRALSPGVVPAVWSRLGELGGVPVDVIAGSRDLKYVALGRRLVTQLPDARLHVVPGAGHGLLREAPAAVAAVLTQASGSRAPGPPGR